MNDTFSRSSLKATVHSFSLQAQCVVTSLENVSMTLAAKKKAPTESFWPALIMHNTRCNLAKKKDFDTVQHVFIAQGRYTV